MRYLSFSCILVCFRYILLEFTFHNWALYFIICVLRFPLLSQNSWEKSRRKISFWLLRSYSVRLDGPTVLGPLGSWNCLAWSWWWSRGIHFTVGGGEQQGRRGSDDPFPSIKAPLWMHRHFSVVLQAGDWPFNRLGIWQASNPNYNTHCPILVPQLVP